MELFPQQLTVLTVGVACSSRPEDDKIHLAFWGRLVPRVSEEFCLSGLICSCLTGSGDKF